MIKEKKMKRVLRIITAGFLFSFFSFGPAFAQAQKVPQKTPELLTQGKKLYEQNCQPCHGPKGDGKGPSRSPTHSSSQRFQYALEPMDSF